MTDKWQTTDFDPNNPICPHCGRSLLKGKEINQLHYDEPKGIVHIVVCKCRTLTSYFVPKNSLPNDPYVMRKITND